MRHCDNLGFHLVCKRHGDMATWRQEAKMFKCSNVQNDFQNDNTTRTCNRITILRQNTLINNYIYYILYYNIIYNIYNLI